MSFDYTYKTEPLPHQKEFLERTAHLPTHAVFWEMGCVDSETEYLSPTGWKKISEYQGGKVAQWDVKTKKAEFIEPINYIKLPCEKMLHVKHTAGVDQMLSAEHVVPVTERDGTTIRLISAEQLYYECTEVSKRGRDLPSIFFMEGQEGISLTDIQLRIQIAVMADGSFPSNCNTIKCGINLKRPRKIERLTKLLQEANIEYKLKIQEDGYHKFGFAAPLRLKTYSEIFWKASSAQLAIICDEVMHWDGSIKERQKGRSISAAFYSTKEQDVDFIQYAFATQGKITRKVSDIREGRNTCWALKVRCKEPFFNVGRKHMTWKQSIDGHKYCFTVPHGFLILRRNGCVFPTGNCGKSKVMIDNIAYLYEKGEIDGALVVAPNGVDLNWLLDEIPAHFPNRLLKDTRFFRFSTKKSEQKWHKEEVKWMREHTGLAFMMMSYDAFMTHNGKNAALKFMEDRKVFYVLDESVCIKTPGAKRTQRITKTGWRAKYKRILDGYPTPKGAFDLYSQIKFLDDEFWQRHHWNDASIFRSYFGVFETKTNHNTDTTYQQLLGYQHLDELNKLIEPISSRLLKDDVLDLPPKIYQPRYFDLSPQQRKLYDELAAEFRLWLDQETLVTANLSIVRLLRLQQISCGYLPTGEDEPVHMIEGKNTRLELLEETLDLCGEKTIIWCRYRLDIELISDLLRKNTKRKFVTYIGGMNEDDQVRARKEFQDGDAEIFLGTPNAAGIGLTLHAAHYSIYYSNSFDLRLRKQSEDRVHRKGLKHSANYIDLLGNNTVDKRIMKNLCTKMDTGDIILGDTPGNDIRTQLKEWLA